MTTCRVVVLGLVALLTTGVAYTQDIAQPPDPEGAFQAACLVDDRLSVWLSLYLGTAVADGS